MFYNLGTLDDRVQSVEQRLLDNFQSQIADYLDLKQLSKNKDRMISISSKSKYPILFL